MIANDERVIILSCADYVVVEFHFLNGSPVHVIDFHFVVIEHEELFVNLRVEKNTPCLILLVDLKLTDDVIMAQSISHKDVTFCVHGS